MIESTLPYNGTTIARGAVVPLISSYVAGPLRLLHLPRLWLKALLHAKDILAEDWGCGPGGLDKFIMRDVGIDGNAFIPWLAAEMPAYETCEAWVREHATALDDATIARSNEHLLCAPLPRDLGAQFRAHLGLNEPATEIGIMLNNYDDWDTVHRATLARAPDDPAIAPVIGPSTTGLLGVPQLARQWLKAFLATCDAAPADYPFLHEAADDAMLIALHIDPSAARAFIAQTQPTYVAYERWIAARARGANDVDWEAIAGLDAASRAATEHGDRVYIRDQILARAETAAMRDGVFAFDVSGRLRR